jgi:hypothetical protein
MMGVPSKTADGPAGMAARIGKLASRPQGASRAELIKLTKWEQQAWKWYFFNSRGTGWCQRHGYNLQVLKGDDGETRYHVVVKK